MNKYGYEVACRLGMVSVLLAMVAGMNKLPDEIRSGYYFHLYLIGTILSMACTWPLGHNAVAKDLRGIWGWALLVEVVYLIAYLFFRDVYLQYMQHLFRPIEHGVWLSILCRMFWFVTVRGRFVGYPRFDFVRILMRENSDHFALSALQKIAGYALLIGSFCLGFVLDLRFDTATFLFAPGLFVMFAMRSAAADTVDD